MPSSFICRATAGLALLTFVLTVRSTGAVEISLKTSQSGTKPPQLPAERKAKAAVAVPVAGLMQDGGGGLDWSGFEVMTTDSGNPDATTTAAPTTSTSTAASAMATKKKTTATTSAPESNATTTVSNATQEVEVYDPFVDVDEAPASNETTTGANAELADPSTATTKAQERTTNSGAVRDDNTPRRSPQPPKPTPRMSQPKPPSGGRSGGISKSNDNVISRVGSGISIVDESGQERVSIEQQRFRLSAAGSAGSEPGLFTWLMVLMLLFLSTIVWLWFCCVR